MLNSLFSSIWPVPIGFLLSLLVIMACFFRKRFFSCLRGKQSGVESGTYTPNGELNTGLELPINADPGIMATSAPTSEIINGQQSQEIGEYPILILPNHSSAIRIMSSPINDTLNRGSHQNEESEQDSFGDESPPPSYSSLFYSPPPKYEDVVTTQ